MNCCCCSSRSATHLHILSICKSICSKCESNSLSSCHQAIFQMIIPISALVGINAENYRCHLHWFSKIGDRLLKNKNALPLNIYITYIFYAWIAEQYYLYCTCLYTYTYRCTMFFWPLTTIHHNSYCLLIVRTDIWYSELPWSINLS